MTDKLELVLHNRQQAWALIKDRVFPFLKEAMQAGRVWVLTIRLETRTQSQNRLMWPILTAFSEQLEWPVNGKMTKISADDFKDVLTAAFKNESVRLAMGLDGGVVMLGQRTSRFTKPQFAEWIEFLYSVAADRSVKLPAWEHGE